MVCGVAFENKAPRPRLLLALFQALRNRPDNIMRITVTDRISAHQVEKDQGIMAHVHV
jgi:hypothetical protein